MKLRILTKADSENLTWKLRFVLVIALISFVVDMSVPRVAFAESTVVVDQDQAILKDETANPDLDLLTQRFIENADEPVNIVDPYIVTREMKVVSTAYSSTKDQTDSTPCITANGYNVCKSGIENVVAANFLKFGTKIRIPELYGDQIFTVQDRMHPRFNNRVDFWKASRESAKKFGVKYIKIQVLKD